MVRGWLTPLLRQRQDCTPKQNHPPDGRVRKGRQRKETKGPLSPSKPHFQRPSVLYQVSAPEGGSHCAPNSTTWISKGHWKPKWQRCPTSQKQKSLQSRNLHGLLQNWRIAEKMSYVIFIVCGGGVHVCEHGCSCASVCTQRSEDSLKCQSLTLHLV